jgi:hypothetical protein
MTYLLGQSPKVQHRLHNPLACPFIQHSWSNLRTAIEAVCVLSLCAKIRPVFSIRDQRSTCLLCTLDTGQDPPKSPTIGKRTLEYRAQERSQPTYRMRPLEHPRNCLWSCLISGTAVSTIHIRAALYLIELCVARPGQGVNQTDKLVHEMSAKYLREVRSTMGSRLMDVSL